MAEDRRRYVITYPNAKFVGIDKDSGYPYAKDDSPHIWYKKEDAVKIKDMFPKEELEIWEMEYTLKEEGVTSEIEVFVDTTDFVHEIGAGNAQGPHNIYNSIEEIKKKQPCAEQCGIIRAKLVRLETVLPGDWKAEVHGLSLFKKYSLAKEALNNIANEEKNAQVQSELALDILDKIKDL